MAGDMQLLFAEDLEIGSVYHLGSYDVTEGEVLEFGRRWDCLPIHVDSSAAAAGPFGGIIASGIHTLAMNQRLLSTQFLSRLAIVAGKGIEQMQLPNPVRPGDTLTSEVQVTDVYLRKGRADITTKTVVTNQNKAAVLLMIGVTVVRRRPQL